MSIGVSFIVPAFNEAALLGATLEALHQAGRALGEPYEILVVDDASTDLTAEVARQPQGAGNQRLLPPHRRDAQRRRSGGRGRNVHLRRRRYDRLGRRHDRCGRGHARGRGGGRRCAPIRWRHSILRPRANTGSCLVAAHLSGSTGLLSILPARGIFRRRRLRRNVLWRRGRGHEQCPETIRPLRHPPPAGDHVGAQASNALSI